MENWIKFFETEGTKYLGKSLILTGNFFSVLKEIILFLNKKSAIYDHDKGLLIYGSIGSGKTLLMQLIKKYYDYQNYNHRMNCDYDKQVYFYLRRAKELENEFIEQGNLDYYVNKVLCLDDLGHETGEIRRFGNPYNPIEELISERYEAFVNYGLKTFATTNKDKRRNPKTGSLEEKYAPHIYSRFHEMFNFVKLAEKDKRR